MTHALKSAKVNDKFQDPLYLFLELVRGGVLHGHLYSGRAFSGGPSFGTGMYCNPLSTLVDVCVRTVGAQARPFPRHIPLWYSFVVSRYFADAATYFVP